VASRHPLRLPMIVGVVVVLAAAGGTVAGLLSRDGRSAPPVQQTIGDPLTDQTNWRRDLGPPNPRIAYATLDGVHLHPFGGARAKLANLVDTRSRWPRQDYLTAMIWSADGRFLAWRQQLMDQPEQESPPTTGLNTLVTVSERHLYFHTLSGSIRTARSPPSRPITPKHAPSNNRPRSTCSGPAAADSSPNTQSTT
jgi:hypothetical protein